MTAPPLASRKPLWQSTRRPTEAGKWEDGREQVLFSFVAGVKHKSLVFWTFNFSKRSPYTLLELFRSSQALFSGCFLSNDYNVIDSTS